MPLNSKTYMYILFLHYFSIIICPLSHMTIINIQFSVEENNLALVFINTPYLASNTNIASKSNIGSIIWTLICHHMVLIPMPFTTWKVEHL